jgi:hypothetical protein
MGAGIAKEKEKGGGKRDNGKGAVAPSGPSITCHSLLGRSTLFLALNSKDMGDET